MMLPVNDPVYRALLQFGEVKSFKLTKERATAICNVEMVVKREVFEADDPTLTIAEALRKDTTIPNRRPGTSIQVIARSLNRFDFAELTMGFAVVWQVVRDPEQTLKPPITYPVSVSAVALALLKKLALGAEFTVWWHLREATPFLDNEPMDEAMWKAFCKELEQKGTASFYDGYEWSRIECVQYPYTESYDIEATEDHLLVGHRLNERGRQFVETHRKAKQL